MKKNRFVGMVNRNCSLLKFLNEKLPDLSNKTIKNYAKFKKITVNKKIVTNVNINLLENDVVSVNFLKDEIKKTKLQIVYEDDDFIVINKPCGLLSISNSKEKEYTAFRLVSDYIKTKDKKARLFVVHRLDQDTSGILLFSKNLKLKEKLQENWNEIVKLREYIAVTTGKTPLEGTIKSYLTMNHFQKIYSTKNTEIGKLAITNYKRLDFKNNYSLLKVNIDTGRRNQIRVHLSELGYPIVGDKKYGCKDNSIKRLALHASKLILTDPRNGKELVLSASTPKQLTNLLK